MSFAIKGRMIGEGAKPFIIAEMSGNHNQSIERALEIVDQAASAGADAIKLQTYTADTMTLKMSGGKFDINDKNSLWNGMNLHDLYSKAYTPWEWHKSIFERADRHGLICFSSPFDETAVDFLEKLNVEIYKIASFEITHLPLIAKVAKTGKPIIMSTGMASLSDIEAAVKTATENGCKDIVLLKCTSTYPAEPINSNINTIPHLKNLFKTEVGLSDHTKGVGVAIASIALGASVIEKHFTLSRADGGVDSEFSMEPDELKLLVEEVSRAHKAMGDITYGPTNDEKNSLIFRRSIYVAEDIEKGDIFTEKNLRIVRPGDGAKPKLIYDLLGKRSTKQLKKGTPFSLDLMILG